MADKVSVIDFSAYSLDRDEPDLERFEDMVNDIHEALTTVGGFYLKNHGISPEKVLFFLFLFRFVRLRRLISPKYVDTLA